MAQGGGSTGTAAINLCSGKIVQALREAVLSTIIESLVLHICATRDAQPHDRWACNRVLHDALSYARGCLRVQFPNPSQPITKEKFVDIVANATSSKVNNEALNPSKFFSLHTMNNVVGFAVPFTTDHPVTAPEVCLALITVSIMHVASCHVLRKMFVPADTSLGCREHL